MKLAILTKIKKSVFLSCIVLFICSCSTQNQQDEAKQAVVLTHGIDKSAGNVSSYIITTDNATYYLEKKGGAYQAC